MSLLFHIFRLLYVSAYSPYPIYPAMSYTVLRERQLFQLVPVFCKPEVLFAQCLCLTPTLEVHVIFVLRGIAKDIRVTILSGYMLLGPKKLTPSEKILHVHSVGMSWKRMCLVDR